MALTLLNTAYEKIADLPPAKFEQWLTESSRENLQSWLIWNDHNGVYSDEQSIREFGEIGTKEQFIECIKNQINN